MPQTLRKLYYRLFKPHSLWHMRHYTRNFNIRREASNAPTVQLYKALYPLSTWDSLKTLRQNSNLSILASGPSIQDLVSEDLKNSDLAFVNGALKLSPKFQNHTNLKYFLVTDPNFIELNFQSIQEFLSDMDHLLLSPRALFEVTKQDTKFLEKHSQKLLLVEQLHEPYGLKKYTTDEIINLSQTNKSLVFNAKKEVGFSSDPYLGIFNGGTVVYSMLQLAAFLQYQDIKIYGMDLGGKQRFYKETKQAPSYLDRDFEKLILPSMKLAKSFMNAQGQKIYNMSPNSRLSQGTLNE